MRLESMGELDERPEPGDMGLFLKPWINADPTLYTGCETFTVSRLSLIIVLIWP